MSQSAGYRLAAALKESPLAEVASLVSSPSPEAVAALLFCAGLWIDGQWMRDRPQLTGQPGDCGGAGGTSAIFRRAKHWRETQLLSFGDWEQPPGFSDGQATTVVMEFCEEHAEEIIEMPAARSRTLGVTLGPAVLLRAPAPAFVTFWEQGRPLSDIGAPAEDVARLETLVDAFAPRWLKASSLPASEAGRERAELALAWANALLDVRARNVHQRAGEGRLTAGALDRWERVSHRLTGDLKTVGWRLGSAADLTARDDMARYCATDSPGPALRTVSSGTGESVRGAGPAQMAQGHLAAGPDAPPVTRVPWTVPSTGSGEAPRWVRPPILPIRVHLIPFAGTPGEGTVGAYSVTSSGPHPNPPNPLPEYREMEPEGRFGRQETASHHELDPAPGAPLMSSATMAEMADPQPAPSTWHDLVLAVTWKAEEAGMVGDGGLAAGLWAAADELHRRHGDTALNGPDASFKQAVIERFWEPLYGLGHQAFGFDQTPDAAGRSWLNALKQHLSVSAGLVVLAANQTEASRFRSPGPGDPAGRPALIDVANRETLSFGIHSRPAAAAPPQLPSARVSTAAAMPRERSTMQTSRVQVQTGSANGLSAGQLEGLREGPVEDLAASAHLRVTAPWSGIREAAPAPPTPSPEPATAAPAAPACLADAEAADAETQSIWHALVRRLFEDRRRLIPDRLPADERDRRRRLMGLAGEIDRQQQQFVIDLPDQPFKERVAEEFFTPLCSLALECYGVSFTSRDLNRGGSPDAGATWLTEMQQALGLAQLQLRPPLSAGAEKRANWFDESTADEPPGRPAVFDIESGQLVRRGTQIVPRR